MIRRAGADVGTMLLAAAIAAGAGSVAIAGPASAGSEGANGGACVGGSGCMTTLAAAVGAAHSGDTIRLAAGTYTGGVTIGKDLHIVGAGAGRTVIKGGGPVLTITTPESGPPAVSLAALTITGGVTHGDGVDATGGGIYVPAGPGSSTGATVSLTGVDVTGNRTVPFTTSPSPSGVPCPEGDCPFAESRGAGIANYGTLTLVDSAVSRNSAIGRASDAVGGGIFSAGPLTLTSSRVEGNRVAPAGIGRFAEGGGIFMEGGGKLTLRDSRVNRNVVELKTSWPKAPQGVLLDMNANSGAIHIGDGSDALIEGTEISQNVVIADDTAGEILAFDAALLVRDGYLTMRPSTVSDNVLTVATLTSEDVGSSGTAMEFNGPGEITDSRITGNSVTVSTGPDPDAVAEATSGLAVYDFFDNPRQVTLRRVLIRGNTARAVSLKGRALTTGAGIFNNSLLSLNNVVVSGNLGSADAPRAQAQGAGIWNGPFLSGPPVKLDLHDTTVTANRLTVSAGGTSRGAGLYTTVPVTLDRSAVSANAPDQCFGC